MNIDSGKEYMKSIPEHKTNILPLRWFANACNMYPSHWALCNALRHEYDVEDTGIPLSKAGHRWWKLYTIFDAPYRRWGTSYRVIDWEI
jgi:hypothetical protein